MTPLEIEMLLHYHCRADEHPRLDAPAVRDALHGFLKDGILRTRTVEEMRPAMVNGSSYTPTERGCTLVRALCAVPYPESRWVMPEPYPTPEQFK